MINEDELTLIRQKADIVDIMSDYITLTKKGKNYVCLCPFHNDVNNPSMVVSKEKQIFNCFSCKTGGNVFTFVQKYENVGFVEAVSIVASKVGINLNKNNYQNVSENKYQKLYNIMNLSQKYYLNNINTERGINAKKYLNNRGITDDIIKEFSIGVSFNEKDNLYQFLKNQNFEDNDITSLGLINIFGIDIYDSFKNRIMIPITNLQNEVVGFTGRIFNNENEAKYINTKETVIFKKSDILFNYYNAKKYIRETNKLIIVEGNMDAIKMSSSGIKNVVALMGTFLSKEQIKIIKKLNCEIVLLLDNDEAGYNATIKNGDILLEEKIICDVVRLSDSKDPDEYIEKNGVKALTDNINSAISYLDFKINDLKKSKNLESSKDISLFIKEFIIVLNYLDDITKNVMIDKVSKEFNIDKEIFKIKKDEKIKEIRPAPIIKVNKTKDKYSILSNKIFYYIVGDRKYLKIYKEKLNFFKYKIQRDLASEIDSFYKKNELGTIADFLTYIAKNEVLNQMIMEIISENSSEDLSDDCFIEYLSLIKNKIRDDDIKELKRQAKEELDIEKKVKLINEITNLKKGSVDYE